MGPSDVFDGSYFLHLNVGDLSDGVHLRPGATIALQGWAHGRFLRMNTSIIDASIPTDWTWERFTVVDAGNGKIALHNTFHNRFVLMSSTGMDTSGFRAADELPSDAIWERFTVVDAGDGSIALHSGVHSRFVSLSDDGIVGVSEERNASDLPSAIERFRVVQDSLPDPESWELFTVVDAGDGKIALHNAVHNRFATWLWGFLVRMNGEDMETSVSKASSDFPVYSAEESFAVRYFPSTGEIALHNTFFNRYVRMTELVVDSSEQVDEQDFLDVVPEQNFKIVTVAGVPEVSEAFTQVFALESPEFAKGDGEERHLRFRYCMKTVEIGRMMLQSWDGASWTTEWSPRGYQIGVWNRADVRLPDDAQALRFLGITSGPDSNMGLAGLALDLLQTFNLSTATPLPNYDIVACSFETDSCSWRAVSDQAWRLGTGWTPSSDTGPSAAFDGNRYMYLEASSPNYPNKVFVLESPVFRKFDGEERHMHVHYHMHGESMGQLTLQFWHGMQWTTVWSLSGSQGDEWHHALVTLPEDAQALRFLGMTGTGWASDIGLDKLQAAGASSMVECSSPRTACDWTSGTVDQEFVLQSPVFTEGTGLYFEYRMYSLNGDSISMQLQAWNGSLTEWQTGDLAVHAIRTAVAVEDLACDDFQVNCLWLEHGTVGPNRAAWRVADVGLEASGEKSETAVLDSAHIRSVGFEAAFVLSFQVVGPTAGLEMQQLTETGWMHLQTTAISSSYSGWQLVTGPISVQTRALRLLATMNSTTDLVRVRSFHSETGASRSVQSLEDAHCDFEDGFCKWTGDWLRTDGSSAAFRGQAFASASQTRALDSATEVLLKSPFFPGADAVDLAFAFRMRGWASFKLSLDMWSSDGSWQERWFEEGQQGEGWQQVKLRLPATVNRVRFRGYMPPYSSSFIAVDDVLLLSSHEHAKPTTMVLAGGHHHQCGLAFGQLKCFGKNSAGQLGYGTSDDIGDDEDEVGLQLPVVDVGGTVLQACGGANHTCAVLQRGSLKCWGSNIYGQIGSANATGLGDDLNEMGDSLPAVDLGNGTKASQVACGSAHTCVLLHDGAIKCFGYNGDGQLGLGDSMNRGEQSWQMGDALPTLDLGSFRATQVTAGFRTSCALSSDRVLCWGRQFPSWEIVDNVSSLATIGFDQQATQIGAGEHHACVRLADGRMRCWGQNEDGQLGLGDTVSREAHEAADVDLGSPTTQIFVGSHHSCAVLQDERTLCWGRNSDRELGRGTAIPIYTSPGEVLVEKVQSLSMGEGHICFLQSGGSMSCFGANDHGQLGVPLGEESAEDGAALVPRLFSARTPRAEGLESVRLSGGSSTWGFLEVLREGIWSPVCDDGFDTAAATVACKDPAPWGDLGMAAGMPLDSFYVLNNTAFAIDDISCNGEELLARESSKGAESRWKSFDRVQCSWDDWVDYTVAGPRARHGHSMVWDAEQQTALIFGGPLAISLAFPSLDIAASQWSITINQALTQEFSNIPTGPATAKSNRGNMAEHLLAMLNVMSV
ncbi:UVR8 [Symbiodinium sp. CCMP2592]|nr:UVR8 [Symbiodinium sp. CCMP2592]